VSLFAITGLPILLTGAALVGLPILLHLIMRQEPKRMPFPAFRFLKQKRQINQRKIRLRHLLLLLLRMGLIALICLSLWQPTILSNGFSLRGGRPIATVIVLDTSPSMGYVLVAERSGLTETRQRLLKLLDEPAQGSWSCLDEARGRALEILEDLPSGSKVAILDTADRGEPLWSGNLAEARQRVRDIKKPRANSQPVTRALETAYALLARADTELEPGQEPFPRLLAVFSDRTVVSWDTTRVTELQSLRERVPPPSVYHLYVDVGVDKPVNTAITSLEFKPQIVPANQPVILSVTVEAVGGSTNNLLLFSVDGEQPVPYPVNPGPDRPVTQPIRKFGLKPGLHHAKISLLTSDGLPFDNEKFVTFRVREPRNVLALVDMDSGSFMARAARTLGASVGRAQLWKQALDSVGWYTCTVRPASEFASIDFAKFEEITLLDVAKPTTELWDKLEAYVRNGGSVIVAPPLPGDADVAAAYQTEAAGRVLPRKFTRWHDVPMNDDGVAWAWRSLSANRPFLTKFRESVEQNEFLERGGSRPTARGYWQVEAGPSDRVVVAYNDAPDSESRSPAVLEQSLGGRGRVLQFTTPLGFVPDRVHNYQSAEWFYLVLVNEAVRTLVGDSEDQIFNHVAGQNVVIKWPTDAKPGATYYLSGPDVSATDAVIRRDEGQAFFRFGPEKSSAAGSFTLQSEDGKWSDGFSINAPVEESNLDRLAPEAIADLFGPEALTPADKKRDLADILSGRFSQPIELFPFLMILLLMVLAVENLLANKFYRRKRAVA
jgi:Aerotolerance regulator N-terminal